LCIALRPPSSTLFPYTTLFRSFQTLWLIYFSAAFMMILALLQHFVVRERKFMYLILGLNSIVIFFFLFAGLIELADLRYTYLTKDRKSTRLNSSHVKSSYAVFC